MSQSVTFEPGTRYLFQGRGYQVVLILSDGMLVARNLDTNALVSQRLTDLWHHWHENTLEFARESPNLDEQATTPLKAHSPFPELADLPPHLREIAQHRYQLIRPLLLFTSRQRTKEVVEARIQTYLSSLHPASAPHTSHSPEPEEHQAMLALSPHLAPFFAITPRTVSRWIRRYQQSHQDIRSLVPSYHQRGPRHHRLSPLLESFLQEAIKETYLTNVRAPVTHVITAFKKRIIQENATRPAEEHLLAPGDMTVYRYIQRLDALDVDTAHLGKAHAQRKHHQTQLGPLPIRPNQRAELDFARLDLLVIDPNDRLPIGRPTIAAIRDKYTGYPLGVFISFDPPSYRVAMECMLYAFLPKEHVQTQFHTQHAYLAFGIPEVLVVDNAMELDRDLELACLQLGIELQHMPVRKPWFKGSIERWFRTLNTDLIHVTPGTTFSHFLERGDYQSQDHACITLDKLWELLHLWIVDVYTQEVHRGIGGHPHGKGIPAKLWEQALEEQFVPRLPPSRNDLLVLVSRTTTRTIHHYGIEFEQLRYQDPKLAALRSKLAQAKKYRSTHSAIALHQEDEIKAGMVHIKYYPGDLSRIWVLDPFSNCYLEIEAVDKNYTQQLSLWKHRVIKRYVQEELKRQVDQQALVLAKARLQHCITDEMRLTRKLRTRQGMTRWWNAQVTTWINESAHHEAAQVSIDAPQEQCREASDGQASLESSLDVDPAITHHPLPTAGIADLSAPLGDTQAQVCLLPDDNDEELQSPFEPFPPLSLKEHIHPGKKRRAQQTANNTKGRTSQKKAQPSTTREQQEGQDPPFDTEQQQTLESIPSIHERQQSFGIHVRSTYWR